jgi:hypothetical protein
MDLLYWRNLDGIPLGMTAVMSPVISWCELVSIFK